MIKRKARRAITQFLKVITGEGKAGIGRGGEEIYRRRAQERGRGEGSGGGEFSVEGVIRMGKGQGSGGIGK